MKLENTIEIENKIEDTYQKFLETIDFNNKFNRDDFVSFIFTFDKHYFTKIDILNSQILDKRYDVLKRAFEDYIVPEIEKITEGVEFYDM